MKGNINAYMKQILLITVIVSISTATYSQKEKLSWLEKYRFYNQTISDSIDSEIAHQVQDSLINRVFELTGTDFESDSILWTGIEKQIKTDSIQLDTFEIYILKIEMSRGGDLILIQSENNPIDKEKLKKNMIFNMIEMENYMSKTRNFPCELIDNIFVHYKLSGKSGLLDMKYKLACDGNGNLEIIRREESFKLK